MKRIYRISIILTGLVILLSTGTRGQNQAQEAAEPEKPLLRIDLLQTLDRELKPPTRNIFSPEKARTQTVQPNIPGLDPSGQTGTDVSPTEGGMEVNEAANASINLSYKGFVRAGERFVALVMYEGMAMAVLQGDFIAEGVEIGTITPEEIEVIGPSADRQKFPIEGDQE
jgi:hypothetical protein